MSRTLITGATGFLGRHLVQQWLADKPAYAAKDLRVLSTSGRPGWLPELVDWVRGSLTEVDVVARATEGTEQIFHLAGRVSTSKEDAHLMYQVHVEGTRNLLRAAQKAGVQKVVMASTSGTIAVSTRAGDRPDESNEPPTAIVVRWPYYASKLYQERVAREICQDGKLQLCTLNPSLLLGPGDDRLSSTADVVRFLQQDIPLVPTGGLNFIDVRDAATAFLAAMERGHHGERYLLGGFNWTFADFFGRLERLSKVAGPKVKAPNTVAVWGARLLDGLYRQLDKAPPVEATRVEMATYYWYFDDTKARQQLGLANRDPSETLLDTVQYLRQHVMGRGAFSASPR